MGKTANLYARIEPETKEQAEAILASLGVPVSNAITMFYRQIILRRGLPFDVRLPEDKLLFLEDLSTEALDAELEKGYRDMVTGKRKPVAKVFTELLGEAE